MRLEIIPSDVRDVAANQPCLLLVHAPCPGEVFRAWGSIPLSVECPGASVEGCCESLVPGEVAEILVTPRSDSVGEEIAVRACVPGTNWVAHATLEVTEAPIEIASWASDAVEIRDRFVEWIDDVHPELGIDEATEWTAIPIRVHRLVVWWHVTIAPHDWARMALRRRYREASPSFAAEIESRSAGLGPHEMLPPAELIR